jgi:ribosomal protein S18 acetylase RimI-like enzyme
MDEIHQLTALPQPWADPHLSAAMAASLLGQGGYGLWSVGAQGEGGYALVHTPEGMPAELLTLWVPEARRGQGHAKALLRHVLGTLRQPLLLEVRASNVAAWGLYTSLGGEQIHVRPGYYPATAEGPAEDALVLRLMPR